MQPKGVVWSEVQFTKSRLPLHPRLNGEMVANHGPRQRNTRGIAFMLPVGRWELCLHYASEAQWARRCSHISPGRGTSAGVRYVHVPSCKHLQVQSNRSLKYISGDPHTEILCPLRPKIMLKHKVSSAPTDQQSNPQMNQELLFQKPFLKQRASSLSGWELQRQGPSHRPRCSHKMMHSWQQPAGDKLHLWKEPVDVTALDILIHPFKDVQTNLMISAGITRNHKTRRWWEDKWLHPTREALLSHLLSLAAAQKDTAQLYVPSALTESHG